MILVLLCVHFRQVLGVREVYAAAENPGLSVIAALGVGFGEILGVRFALGEEYAGQAVDVGLGGGGSGELAAGAVENADYHLYLSPLSMFLSYQVEIALSRGFHGDLGNWFRLDFPTPGRAAGAGAAGRPSPAQRQ